MDRKAHHDSRNGSGLLFALAASETARVCHALCEFNVCPSVCRRGQLGGGRILGAGRPTIRSHTRNLISDRVWSVRRHFVVLLRKKFRVPLAFEAPPKGTGNSRLNSRARTNNSILRKWACVPCAVLRAGDSTRAMRFRRFFGARKTASFCS